MAQLWKIHLLTIKIDDVPNLPRFQMQKTFVHILSGFEATYLRFESPVRASDSYFFIDPNV